MRDRLERFLLLPFSIGCSFRSRNVAVSVTKLNINPKSHSKQHSSKRRRLEEEGSSQEKIRSPFRFLSQLAKPKISTKLHKFFRSIKSLSHFFGCRKGDMEKEMKIGYPTDVKHITHIGADAISSINNVHTKAADEVISLRQFELAVASQANGSLVLHPSKLP